VTRLLGIDLGTRRIGIAVGDTATGAVAALTTIRRADVERDARTIGRLALEQRADELVVGLPLNMNGSEGGQAQATREWAVAVAELAGMPLSWRDERLTTQHEIDRIGGPGRGASGGAPSAARRNSYRARLDRLAAAAIVQAELDARARDAAAPTGAPGSTPSESEPHDRP
jgi:putative Holliday junction resolvase